MTPAFGVGMVWLVLFATFAAYSVYYTSLRLFPVAQVSAAIYLSPPVTMLWAWALFSEPLTPALGGADGDAGRRLDDLARLSVAEPSRIFDGELRVSTG